jgi:hypothetical protein
MGSPRPPPPQPIPPSDHPNYTLVLRLAEKIALKENRAVEAVWLDVMSAVWAGHLKTLAVFCLPRSPGKPGRDLLPVNREHLGGALLDSHETLDLAPLADWRLQDYLPLSSEAFHVYFKRDPRLGLAVLNSEVASWRDSSPLEVTAPVIERTKDINVPAVADAAIPPAANVSAPVTDALAVEPNVPTAPPGASAAPPVTDAPAVEVENKPPQRERRRTRQRNLILTALKPSYGVELTDSPEEVKQKTSTLTPSEIRKVVYDYCDARNLPEDRRPDESTIDRAAGRKPERQKSKSSKPPSD